MAELWSLIQKHWRGICIAALVAIGGFGMTAAFTKGMLDFIPNWVVFLLLAVPFVLLLVVSSINPEISKYRFLVSKHPNIAIPSLILFIFSCILIIWLIFYVTIMRPDNIRIRKNQPSSWQPPELPKNCKDVIIWFGNQRNVFKMDMLTNFSFAPGISNFVPIHSLPENIRTNLPNMHGFSPHLKDVLGFERIENIINGKKEDFYPVLPQVISNRLYVFVKIPFTNYKKIMMSEEMDSILINCLPQAPDYWDWNYTRTHKTNIFEIVDQNKKPIVQVVYKTPREVVVSGVFFVSKYDVQVAFRGEKPRNILFPNIKTNVPIDSFGMIFTNQFGGVISTNMPQPGKHELPIYQAQLGPTNLTWNILIEDIYSSLATNQKPIFKYPSNIYPGKLADSYKQKNAREFNIVLWVAYSILGFGVIWMCFGWVFLNKSDTNIIDNK